MSLTWVSHGVENSQGFYLPTPGRPWLALLLLLVGSWGVTRLTHRSRVAGQDDEWWIGSW